jgi:TM2 domain-containing membrane protein YozV
MKFFWIILVCCLFAIVRSQEDECANDFECGQGECVTKKLENDTEIHVCKCDDKWITIADAEIMHEDHLDSLYCNYKQKSKLTAFLLSFFVGGYGADYFYLGYIGMGVGKLIISFGFCIAMCVAICFVAGLAASDSGTAAGACGIVCGIILAGCVLTSIIWWFVTWGMILTNDLPDVNGIALYKDM